MSEDDALWRRLVFPPGYRNPTPAARYHLTVIGAGTAGLVTAIVAAGLSAILLLGVGYVTARASRLTRSVQVVGAGDWAHKLTATVAVTVTVAAVGVAAVSPDAIARGRAPSTAPGLANGPSPGVGALLSPTQSTDLGPADTARLVSAEIPRRHGSITELVTVEAAKHPNQGCGRNPTSAPPPVPIGRHSYGAPVTHPSKGGCQV